jgi:hypothetical protein
LFETTLFNTSDPLSLGHTTNITSVADLVSALQLYGAHSGVGYALPASGVDLFSYRNSLDSLANLGTLHLSLGGSTDTTTAVSFNAPAFENVSNFDVRLMTFAKNPYAHRLKGTAGSAVAAASRADQVERSGPTLLRSKVTMVWLAQEDEVAAVEATAFDDAVAVTLAATAPFDANHSAYVVARSCTVDGASLTLACPLADVDYTCDFAARGRGSKYSFAYSCAMVAPTCLWWDAAAQDFSAEGCAVVAGYAPAAVTCACDRLAAFALGANLTAPAFAFDVTDAPTARPSVAPSPGPTHGPTALPTSSPPTLVPTAADTVTAAVSLQPEATAEPTDADARAFRTVVAAALGVTEGAARNLALATASSSRVRALLALSYSWSVSFDVSVSLSSTTFADANAFAAAVSTELNSVAFVVALNAAVASITRVGTVTAEAVQPAPSRAPVAAPAASPTAGSTPAPTSSPGSAAAAAAAASSSTAFFALVAGAGVAAVLVGVAVQRRHAKRAKRKKVAPASPLDAPKAAPDDRLRLDPLSDGGGSVVDFLEVTTSRLRPWGYTTTTTTTTTTTPAAVAPSPWRSPPSPPPFQLLPTGPQLSPISYHDLVRAGRPLAIKIAPAPLLRLQASEAAAESPERRVVRLRPLARPQAGEAVPSLFAGAAAPRFGDGRRRVAPLPLVAGSGGQNGGPEAARRRPPLSADDNPASDAPQGTWPAAVRSPALTLADVDAAVAAAEDALAAADAELEAAADRQAALEAQAWGFKAELRRASLARARGSSRSHPGGSSERGGGASSSEAARKLHEAKLLQELDRKSRALAAGRARAEQRRARAAAELTHALGRAAPEAAGAAAAPDLDTHDRRAAFGLPRRLEPLLDPLAPGSGGGVDPQQQQQQQQQQRRSANGEATGAESASRLAQRLQHQKQEQEKRKQAWKQHGPYGL